MGHGIKEVAEAGYGVNAYGTNIDGRADAHIVTDPVGTVKGERKKDSTLAFACDSILYSLYNDAAIHSRLISSNSSFATYVKPQRSERG